MKSRHVHGPQHTGFFRIVAFLSRLQLRYHHQTSHPSEVFVAIHLFCAGITALSTFAFIAHLTGLMVLFPPLGPSAFILFYTPLSEAASPRSLILAHTLALISGLAALALTGVVFPGINETAQLSVNWSNVTAIGLAMGAVSVGMVAMKCIHPPAAATALIAAMGYLGDMVQVASVLVAVLFLALEAYFFNRILGGLPYPRWRFDTRVEKTHRSLTGFPDLAYNRWQKLAEKTFQRRN